MGNCCNYRMITTRKIYKEFNSYFVMVKTSTKAVIGVAMYAASTVAGFAEDIKKSFKDSGKTYLLSQDKIITWEDNAKLIYRQDDSGDWFYDKNDNKLNDNNEDYMSNDFRIRAERAKNLEKLAEFEYQSNRPDENKGKTFEYELWSDGTISQKDKPSVTFSQNWRYDSDAKGIMTWMHDEFNEKANNQIKDAFGSLIDRYNTSQEEIKELKKERKELTDIVEYHADGKGNVAFVVDALMGDGFGYAGIGASMKLSDRLGLTGTILAGAAKDKVLETITTESSPMGIYGEAIKEQTNLEKLGASLELAVNLGKGFNLSLGGGVMRDKWDEEIVERFYQGENILNEVSSSNTDSQVSGFIRGGIGKEFGESGFAMRGIVDYNPVDQTFAAGMGFSYRPQVKGKQ